MKFPSIQKFHYTSRKCPTPYLKKDSSYTTYLQPVHFLEIFDLIAPKHLTLPLSGISIPFRLKLNCFVCFFITMKLINDI